MATFHHPVTGIWINQIDLRDGPISDKELLTARLLLQDEIPRWVVAPMLGRFPLAFKGTGGKVQDTRRKFGGNLSAAAAHADPRQSDMDWLFGEASQPGPGTSE